MINTINTVFILLLLFFVLGKSADKIVYCARIVVEKMGIPMVFLGAILGLFTSLPETAIGVNAMLNNIEGLALGNLLGGIFVLLCFVLGASLVLNRQTRTDGKIANIIPIFLFLFFPFALGFDGRLNYMDALIIISGYIAVLFYLFKRDTNFSLAHISVARGDRMAKIWLYLIISVILIILSSNMIVREATLLLQQTALSPFILGLIVFSIGTNLPEIAVMFRAWKRGVAALSVSHLLGSAMANILLIGLFSLFRTIRVANDFSFLFLFSYLLLISIMLVYFYRSDKTLSKKEGYVLLGSYLIFVAFNLWQSS